MTTSEILIHPPISGRYSPLAFAARAVEQEKLLQLFEAARWAASAFNEQPWRYVFATKEQPELYQRLFDLMVPANQEWAQTAPVLILSIAKKTFSLNGNPNPHYLHDTGAASAQMSIQASAIGLETHQMAGFDAQKARTSLQIPDDFEPVAMMAVGYPGDVSILSERLQQRAAAPRKRKAHGEIFFNGTFKQ